MPEVIPEVNSGPSSANRIAVQLSARANQQSRQASQSQSLHALQQQLPPLYPPQKILSPALSDYEAPPLPLPQQAHQDSRHSRSQLKRSLPAADEERDWSYCLTTTVNWGNPHSLENDRDMQVSTEKKRKVAIAVVSGSGDRSKESQYMEDKLWEHCKEGKCCPK